MTRPRRGYTLLEIVLVMAVMVILAGLLYPSLKGMLGYYKLQGGVDAVRAAWANARARAILDGRPYRFAIEPGGSHFRVAPDHSDYWSGSPPANDPQGAALVYEQSMPAGVRFAVNSQAPVAPVDSGTDREERAPPSGEWTPAAVFLPDGTAREDVRITFQVRGARPTALFLRGLTGTVSVQPVQP